jgi:hypothetical protein
MRITNIKKKEHVMSMRGDIISAEYQKMVWVHDKNGKEYACYANDLSGDINDKMDLSQEERNKCLDLSQVAGDTW